MDNSINLSKNKLNESLNSLNSSKSDENFLNAAQLSIDLVSSPTMSKFIKDNYEEFILNYYFPIIDKIFEKIPNFIDNINKKYNKDFILILNNLYDNIYFKFQEMKYILDNNIYKEKIELFFEKYRKITYELFAITPPNDEAVKFGKYNTLIIFNNNPIMNKMKGKNLQFFTYILQTLSNKNEDNYIINDKNLLIYINRINDLIIESFQDFLNNIESFNFLIKDTEKKSIDLNLNDSYNFIIYQMIAFLTRSLVREPIKTNISSKIKKLLLNLFFPLNKTLDEEINYYKNNHLEYLEYLDDITCKYSIKNFRSGLNFLIKIIGENYEDDITNFMISFNIQMFYYIITEGKIENNFNECNAYLINIKDSKINDFNDDEKLELSLLNILVLKELIKNKENYFSYLLNILNYHFEKLKSIKNPLIKIKLCKILNIYLEYLYEKIEKEEGYKLNIKFIGKIMNYLLENIIQNALDDMENYEKAVSEISSQALIELLKLTKDEIIKELITNNIEKNLMIFNELINILNIESFYILIETILNEIKIEQRSSLFDCLNKLSKKFKLKNKIINKQYLNIYITFLKGINKINKNDKEEMGKFEIIVKEIIIEINNNDNFEFYIDDFLIFIYEYIKLIEGINEKCIEILKTVKNIIIKSKIKINLSIFNFLSIFMSNINKNILDPQFNNMDLFNEIEIILKTLISNIEDINNYDNYYSIQYSFLLSLQLLSIHFNISEEFLSFLMNNCLKFKDIRNNQILQLTLANIALGFIYYTDLTFKILSANNTNLELIPTIKRYIDSILLMFKQSYFDYNILLGKCILLGICGAFINVRCLDFLDNNKSIKILLLYFFVLLMINHKIIKKDFIIKITNKDIKCDFIEDNNFQEDEEEIEETEENKEFNENVEIILKDNINIIKSDEFEYFEKITKYIKKYDLEIYNKNILEYFNNDKNNIEQIYKLRNIKVVYKQKQYFVPRRILKIISGNQK